MSATIKLREEIYDLLEGKLKPVEGDNYNNAQMHLMAQIELIVIRERSVSIKTLRDLWKMSRKYNYSDFENMVKTTTGIDVSEN